jgi:two-component system, cell cycle response regulator CpdR
MPFDDVSAAGLPFSLHCDNGSATILLVDDEEDVRDMCRRALESDGSTVIGADDGLMALSLIQEWPGRLDLVITDLKMPLLDGLAMAEVLSVFRPDLPVLGMTGDPGMADRRLPTLLKPFSLEELLEAARTMRSRTIEMRTWAQEQRARARHARQVAAELKARTTTLRDRVDLVAVALELQRNGSVAPH